MIRVLQVLGGTNLGGAESRIMDIYRHIDREKIQFDFLVTEGNSGFYTPQIEELGGHVYTIPKYRIVNHFIYTKSVKEFFNDHSDYAAVHGHMTSTAAIYLPIAKKAGIPLTIAHARSAGVDSGIKGWLTRMLRKNLPSRCDKMIACSDLAAQSAFGKNSFEDGLVKIMPNAIDAEEFRFDESMRSQIRESYGISDKFVIGHVGRFHESKNHEFLVSVFEKYLEYRDDAVLLLVGDGPLRPQIEQQIEQIDMARVAQGKVAIKDKVIFAGNQSPVSPLYHAFDFFLFPSRFEGMPGTVVEAQASGLFSLISENITRMVKVTDKVSFMSIEKTPEQWAKAIDSIFGDTTVEELTKHRIYDNSEQIKILLDSDYDVNRQIEYYVNLYRA